MKQIILGTSGHIDHGKTSLVKALTGIDADRLKEEKERGITIELGFAHLELPSGQTLSIVDVPGHEKFVKNMVAGATGIDLVALIIAGDEGVMPQTREHLEICQLLGIRYGLVVLTKIDMADPDLIELAKEDVKDFLKGTFLDGAPVIEVSSVTGQGIEDLVQAIDDLVQDIPERDPGNFFRLPVDRVFTMKGFGTVVTGSTVSGSISVGDEVTIYPRGLPSRIRGIQVHNRAAGQVRAGLRSAINLQGLEKAQIERGNVIAAKDSLRSSYMVDVELELIPAAPRILKNRAKARFHAGTSEIISTVVLLDRYELKPGERCFAQIRLDQPAMVLQGDCFILRSYSPIRAIGGGKVLNPLPLKKKRFSREVLSDLESLNTGDLKIRTDLFVRLARFKGVDSSNLRFLSNSNKKKLDDVLKTLSSQKRIIMYNKDRGIYIHADFLSRMIDEIISTLEVYHHDNPLKLGLLKEELRSRTVGSGNQRLFNFVINRLIQQGDVVQEQEILRLKEHKVALAHDQKKARNEIEEIYLKGGLQPPYFKDVLKGFSDDNGKDLLEVMLKDEILIKVKENLYFHRDAILDLKNRLIVFLRENKKITTVQFKEMTGASRKYTIPLIEYFDNARVTIRVGDNRVLRENN